MATSTRSSRRSAPRPPRRRLARRRQAPRGRPAVRPGPARTPEPVPAAALDPALLEGVALYNHRRFFECHEVLERLWLRAEGRPREFYKGLIQAAVAFHHWSRGNRGGALTLYRSSRRYLEKYRPAFLGIDVDDFLRRYTELFGWLRRHRLRYDARLVPTIRPVSETRLR